MTLPLTVLYINKIKILILLAKMDILQIYVEILIKIKIIKI